MRVSKRRMQTAKVQIVNLQRQYQNSSGRTRLYAYLQRVPRTAKKPLTLPILNRNDPTQ
jgi:hypothetical protein